MKTPPRASRFALSPGYSPGIVSNPRRPGHRAARSAQATLLQLLRREPERRNEVHVGFIVLTEAAEHLSQCEVRAPVIVEREARFEIRLCFSPKLLALAQCPEHTQ